MEKENRVKMEYMAQFEYLKTIITTRLFGNINTLEEFGVADNSRVIPADLKYNENMSKDGNMERVRWAIMNEIADSPFDNDPIILDKLIEYFLGSEEFEGATEKFGWDIF